LGSAQLHARCHLPSSLISRPTWNEFDWGCDTAEKEPGAQNRDFSTKNNGKGGPLKLVVVRS